jgi:hypothetical protein
MHIKTQLHKAKTKEALEKRRITFARYPKYRLRWISNNEKKSFNTTKKGAFLKRLQSLEKIDKVWFEIEFKKKEKALFKYDEGKTYDEFKNQSVVYTNTAQALKDARIFTAKSEMLDFL